MIELAKVAGQYGGIYARHMRSEGQSEVAAVEEALRIGKEAHVPVEIFHLKVIGTALGSMPKIVAMIQRARMEGRTFPPTCIPMSPGNGPGFEPSTLGC